MDRYLLEIKNRGFETQYETGYKGESWKKARTANIKLAESRRGLRLYVLDSWKKYSRNVVYPCRLVYLAGVDRGVYWAVRCPSSVTSIDQGLEFTTPAKVHKAREDKRRVMRQGDVFIIEKRGGSDNLKGLPRSHNWNPDNRVMAHNNHRSVQIPFTFSVATGKSIRSDAD